MKSKGSNLSSKGFIGLIIAQFLGAFNDNAFKLVISLYIGLGIGVQGYSKEVAKAAACITIPFIIFSTFAGWISDKTSKKRVIVRAKDAEIIVMFLGLLAFLIGNITFLFFVLFLMGTQSAFFSPSKYGILPEIVRDEELSRANGLLQMFTFLAIILGTAVGGILFTAFKGRVYLCSFAFIFVAMIGAVAGRFVQDVKPAKEDKPLELNPLISAYWTYKRIKNDKPLIYTIIAIAFFWFIGALFQLNILVYGKAMMKISEGRTASLLTIIAFGIGFGAYLAGRISSGKIEFGLVPIGSFGMALFCFNLSNSYHSFYGTAVNLFLLGVSSGFFIVPLTAYLQQHSPAADKGENIAFSNLISFTGILFASMYLPFMINILDVNPASIFYTMSIAILLMILFFLKAVPEAFRRMLLWMFIRLKFNVDAIGREHVPKRGGALIVCNNISRLDALLIAFSQQRPVRFIIPNRYYKLPSINWLCRLLKAIPAKKSESKDFTKTLFAARRELEKGNLVCVFPEGGITKTGNLRRFSEHLIRITRSKAPKERATSASRSFPIIPAYIDAPAGGFFGIKRFILSRRRTVCFGKRMPSESSAYEVRREVSLLSVEAFKIRKRENELLHLCFIHTAKKKFFKQFVSDSMGFNLSYGSALGAAMAFSKKLNETLKKNEKMVGVMMPPSCIATLLNFSILMTGRVPVNLNYTASSGMIASAIKQCGIETLFTSGKLLKKLKIKKSKHMLLVEEFFKEIDIVDKLKEYIKALITPKFILKLKYKKGVRKESVATVIFSSGSTGEPKGVMLTHLNILSNVESVRQVLPFREDEKFCGILPFFHSFGFMATLMMPAVYGFETVYHPNPLDAAAIGKLCEAHSCTILPAAPTFLSGYLRKCSAENFDSLRMVLVGSEKLKPRLAKSFYKKFDIHPLEGLGCTELSPVISVNRPDALFEGDVQRGIKVGSVGRALPGVAVKVVDVETGKPLGIEEDGLLYVTGPNVMMGYLNDKEKTDEVLVDGWYNTGDIAQIDADGFITITDRLSRFSKIGGEMVPHIKVEIAIHEALSSDKPVCVVTCVPDEKKGERLVVLHTLPELDVAALWERLNKSSLPKLWIPKKGAFIKIDEIPLLGSGKVALKEIKRLAKELA